MSRSVLDLDPDVRDRALELQRLCALKGMNIKFTQTARTASEQAAIYAQGRTTSGPPCRHAGIVRPIGTCDRHPLGATVTNAPPGYSWHEFRRAFDIAEADATPYDIGDPGEDEVDEAWWKEVGDLGESLELEWGGRWKRPDRPHFHDTGGKTLAQMRVETVVG
jgi:peptidoglycan L-alanyl-D-glutamate endopeptidase CwlK